MSTVVTVSGPGGTIDFEVELITMALRKAGCTVEVVDEHPSTNPIEMLQHRKNLINNGHECTVKVIAKHQPWGG